MSFPVRCRFVLAGDRLAIQAALKTCEGIDPEHPRMVRIRNSLTLDTLSISEALREEALRHPRVREVSTPHELRFAEGGELLE